MPVSTQIVIDDELMEYEIRSPEVSASTGAKKGFHVISDTSRPPVPALFISQWNPKCAAPVEPASQFLDVFESMTTVRSKFQNPISKSQNPNPPKNNWQSHLFQNLISKTKVSSRSLLDWCSTSRICRGEAGGLLPWDWAGHTSSSL